MRELHVGAESEGTLWGTGCCCIKNKNFRGDFSGGPLVRLQASNARGTVQVRSLVKELRSYIHGQKNYLKKEEQGLWGQLYLQFIHSFTFLANCSGVIARCQLLL